MKDEDGNMKEIKDIRVRGRKFGIYRSKLARKTGKEWDEACNTRKKKKEATNIKRRRKGVRYTKT